MTIIFIKGRRLEMKCKTNKLVFYALAAVLVSLLFTCKPFGGAGDYDESGGGGGITYTDVEYAPDGKSITIYLDGSAPVRSSRALNLKMAQIGHDFFEVAFFDPATSKTARATWETGHAAGVNGVARGVDYRYATVPAATATGAVANAGAAILFVGKKSDKTLLAVGRLTGTDDPANGGATFVSANTKSVTFSVAALVAGTSTSTSNLNPESSFVTASAGNSGQNIIHDYTTIIPIMIGKYLFPLYRLKYPNSFSTTNTMYARYFFKVVAGDNINNYREGIIQTGPAVFVPSKSSTSMAAGDHLDPRYPKGDGGWIFYDPDDYP